MKSALHGSSAQELLTRIDRLGEDSRPKWGRFTVARMLTHLVDSLRMAVGDLQAQPRKLPIRYFPLKQLVIYLAPFPRGAPTAPELLRENPEAIDAAKAELRRRVLDFPRFAREGQWPEHPAFGVLSTQAWGVLVYRHMDHHLRQFGA